MAMFLEFLQSEDGAVTVDWVVLTAAIIGFGLVVVGSIAGGASSVSDGLGASLSEAEPPATDLPVF